MENRICRYLELQSRKACSQSSWLIPEAILDILMTYLPLSWAKVRPDAQCWWCKCPSQTRDHLFKVCPEWKVQQKTLLAEVLKETKRWKSRWMVRDLLADGRCVRAVLDFLSSTDVGRLAPPLEEEGDAGSEASEWELRERREREEEREEEAETLGAVEEGGEELPLFLPTPSFMASAGEE